VDVALSVAGEDPDGCMADLVDWLRHEPDFRGRLTPTAGGPRPGELGVVTDLLSVAVGSGGALSVLAVSLKAFLVQPRRSDLRITIRGADGRSVEIDAKRVGDVDALLEATFGRAV
jgi:hypothetical protein